MRLLDNTSKLAIDWRAAVSVTFVFLLLLGVMIGRSLSKPLSHDEHQYVAAAALVAREGLQPYRDFPYFHMPTLVYGYALLFRFTDHLLLSARLVSVACGWLLLLCVFWTAHQAFRAQGSRTAMVLAFCFVTILAANRLFTYTDGWAWNHDTAVLAAVLATVVHHRALISRGVALFFLSGLLIGGAIGIRLSFAPLVVPFLIGILINEWRLPTPSRRYGAQAGSFAVGVVVGLIPALFLFASAPYPFVFGNLIYPRYNTQWSMDCRGDDNTSLVAKSVYLLTRVFSDPSAVCLALPIVAALWLGRLRFRMSANGSRFCFVLSLLPFLIAGAFAPSPCQYQYLYALIPFLLLSAIDGTAILIGNASAGSRRLLLACVVIAAVLSGLWGLPAYRHTNVLLHPDRWVPLRIERQGAEIARCAGTNLVITIAPIYPLSGGARIHPGCVKGALAWRIGHYLSQPKRERLHILCDDNLAPILAAGGAVVLLGSERSNEESGMERLAKEQGFNLARLTPPWRIYRPPGQGGVEH